MGKKSNPHLENYEQCVGNKQFKTQQFKRILRTFFPKRSKKLSFPSTCSLASRVVGERSRRIRWRISGVPRPIKFISCILFPGTQTVLEITSPRIRIACPLVRVIAVHAVEAEVTQSGDVRASTQLTSERWFLVSLKLLGRKLYLKKTELKYFLNSGQLL